VEREEEALTNSLMKKLEKVNSEKREMLMRVEQEEEFLTNQLQKRLDRVVREKAELEAQCHALRRRQESVREESGAPSPLDARDAELRRLTREKVDLERQLEAEQECIVNKLHKQNAGLERERRTLRAECETLRKQVDELSTEKARLGREKVALENTMEAEEEHIVNRLQTQMLELFQRNQALQRRLEAASETPSVVSESDASEDERERLRDRAGGFGRHPHHHPAAHPPWERDMYAAASAGRRRSQGSWSLSSVERVPAASSAPRRPTSGGTARGGGPPSGAAAAARDGGGGWDAACAGGGGGAHATVAANHGGGPKAMSVGGSSATTTPRSSVATTPLSTPRGGRKEKDAKDARGEDKEKMIN
jgi:coiled-coil domain-containing protein 6